MFTPKVSFSDISREEKAENYTDDNHAGNELSGSIDRLCGLATKPGTTVYSDEAQQIIADLASAEVSRYSKQNLDLKKLQGLLISSPCISINEQGRSVTEVFKLSSFVDSFGLASFDAKHYF